MGWAKQNTVAGRLHPADDRPPRPQRRRRLRVADGTLSRSSASQTVAGESLGARQSLRGDSEPPEPTFGPLGMAERLNWLVSKNRSTNTSSQWRSAGRSYSRRSDSGTVSGQTPALRSCQALQARKATLLGR